MIYGLFYPRTLNGPGVALILANDKMFNVVSQGTRYQMWATKFQDSELSNTRRQHEVQKSHIMREMREWDPESTCND